MTRRLLLGASRGGGQFIRLPEQGRWVRQGAVLTAGGGWESNGILEPTVIYVGANDWRMWYRGGGLSAASQAGYATSTDGLSWTKYGSNPILGNGVGGEANRLICPYVVKVGSTFYLYYSEIDTQVLKVATSSTGFSGFTIHSTGLSKPSGTLYFGNTVAWNEGGSTWKMLVEAYHDGDALWKTYYATSSDGLSWTLGNGGAALSTLSPGGLFAAPHPPYLYHGLYNGWYHGATSGNLPTDIYRAQSADLIDWTQIDPNPVLTHLGTDYEIDQVADPHVIEVAGKSYMYYDADDNVTFEAAIKLATFDGSLGQLINGT